MHGSQIKSSKSKGTKAAEKGSEQTKEMGPEPLLGDNIPERKRPKKMTKSKGPTNTINETNIQIYEFIFSGSPNPPNL